MELLDGACLDIVNVLGIPYGPKDLISKSQYEEIVHDFLSKIVIYSEDFILSPIGI